MDQRDQAREREWHRLRLDAVRSAARLAARQGWDDHVADDLAQEALMMRLWDARRTQAIRSPSAWLERVLRRLAADEARRRAALPAPAPGRFVEEGATERTGSGRSVDPEAQVVLSDVWASAPDLLGVLPPPCREIASLQYLRSWSRREILCWLQGWRSTSEGEFRRLLVRSHAMLRALGLSKSPRAVWPAGWTKENRWRRIPPPHLSCVE
jgi:RNA polymerase sigma factor (sigma-70 family)